MSAENEKVRLILGLKVRQLRLEHGLSQHELAQRVGLAHSYLNEIEKGKKYPKADKMMALAQALGTDYDALVSLKLDKKLEPITELLNSRVLSELPLEMFGLEPAAILQLMSEAPDKLSAFVNTLIKLTNSYDLRTEQFYFSALRTYQEMRDNYFPDLEEAAERFLHEVLDGQKPGTVEQVREVLAGRFGYRFHHFDPDTHPAIGNLRSVFVPQHNDLWLNQRMTRSQRMFTLTRECGYQFLGIRERSLESSVVEPESFEHMLNNFRAS
nr:helix-turn-helix domain-containing protein [Cytophagales bacterium]